LSGGRVPGCPVLRVFFLLLPRISFNLIISNSFLGRCSCAVFLPRCHLGSSSSYAGSIVSLGGGGSRLCWRVSSPVACLRRFSRTEPVGVAPRRPELNLPHEATSAMGKSEFAVSGHSAQRRLEGLDRQLDKRLVAIALLSSWRGQPQFSNWAEIAYWVPETNRPPTLASLCRWVASRGRALNLVLTVIERAREAWCVHERLSTGTVLTRALWASRVDQRPTREEPLAVYPDGLRPTGRRWSEARRLGSF